MSRVQKITKPRITAPNSICHTWTCLAVFACLQTPSYSYAMSSDVLTQHVTLKAPHSSLSQCADALAKQIGRGIVIDDEPSLKFADINLDGSASDALNKLAQTFDYSWTLSKTGVILMRKQFQTLEEYPQLHVPELRQAARDALSILSQYPADIKSSDYPAQINALYRLFTPEQAQNLQMGKPIYGYQLTPPQFELTQRLIASTLFDGTQAAWIKFDKQLATPFSAMPQAYFQLRPLPAHYRMYTGSGASSSIEQTYAVFECIYTNKNGTRTFLPLAMMPTAQKFADKTGEEESGAKKRN